MRFATSRGGSAPAQRAPDRGPSLSEGTVDPQVIQLIPRHVAERHEVVPLARDNGVLLLAMVNPNDVIALDEVRRLTGCPCRALVFPGEEIRQAIARYYAGEGEMPSDVVPGVEEEEDAEQVVTIGTGADALEAAPIRLVNQILEQAIAQRVSDIHIEPHDRRVIIRFRIDGVMYDWQNMRHEHHPTMLSRIKVLSHMNIAERRLPLDGRFTVKTPQQQYDVRVSTVPGVYGEKAVLRLLPKGSRGLELEELGLTDENVRLFEEMVQRPYGMVLVTGPTGSGKTTTLYAALRKIDCVVKNAITIEDPVEYELPRVTQIQVHPKIGLTFAAGLRSVLRQDPDVLMVGEIRDAETLQMAVQAALTGHLVLSTLHTNDAAGAAARCIDMGLEPFLLTSSVIAIVAQRLVRRVCEQCKITQGASNEIAQRLGIEPGRPLVRGTGCTACRNTGYRGRLAAFEVLRMTEAVKQAIHNKESASTIRRLALSEGMTSLRQDAVRKVVAGLTTPEEILRAVYLEE
jgi:type II secretory ATPase GspE/PulE/Tfp pilus assembly ATPase PilB-like protein